MVDCTSIDCAVVCLIPVDSRRIAVFPISPDNHRLAQDRHGIAEVIPRPGVARLEVGLLAPRRSIPHKDVGRTGVVVAAVTYPGVPTRGAVFQIGPNNHRLPGDRYGKTEAILPPRIACLEVGLLAPGRSIPHKNVGGAGVDRAIVCLIPTDPRRVAVFLKSPDDHRLSRDRYGKAEVITCLCVARLEVGLLAPDRSVSHEDVGCAGVTFAVACLPPTDPRRVAGFPPSSDDHRLAGDRDRNAEVVPRPGVARLEICLLTPGRSVPDKDVSRAGVARAIVRLRPVDPRPVAGFPIRPDDHRLARDRHGRSEEIIRLRIARLEICLLTPCRSVPHKDVGRPGVARAVVCLISTDSRRVAVFQ